MFRLGIRREVKSGLVRKRSFIARSTNFPERLVMEATGFFMNFSIFESFESHSDISIFRGYDRDLHCIFMRCRYFFDVLK